MSEPNWDFLENLSDEDIAAFCAPLNECLEEERQMAILFGLPRTQYPDKLILPEDRTRR